MQVHFTDALISMLPKNANTTHKLLLMGLQMGLTTSCLITVAQRLSLRSLKRDILE